MHVLGRLRRHYGFRIKIIVAMIGIVLISNIAALVASWVLVLAGQERVRAAYASGAALAFSLLVAVLAGTLMVRRLLRPLIELVKGARAVAAGNMRYHFGEMAPDELGQLGEALNAMLRSFHRDCLTDLLNQHSFYEHLQSEINRAERYGHRIAVMMVDLDHFKTVNDRWGHRAGNELLREAAEVIGSVFRECDTVARYGGDEFAIILPETGEEAAVEVAERLRRLLEQHRFVISTGPPDSDPTGQPAFSEVFITASIGIAEYPTHGTRVDGLLMAADLGMFRAKHASRNCVCTYGHLLLSLEKGSDPHAHRGEQVYSLLEEAVLGAIETLAAAVEARDQGMREHGESVTRYAVAVAHEMGLRPDQIEQVRTASLLHDVGKIGISDAVLNHPGRLNAQERAAVERHVSIGAAIVSKARQLAPIARAIQHHHERYDGTGYPDGLAGEQIPLLARLVAVVDAYEAMTHRRPYRRQLTRAEAIAELRRCAGTQFDSEIVETFTRSLERAAPEPAAQGAA